VLQGATLCNIVLNRYSHEKHSSRSRIYWIPKLWNKYLATQQVFYYNIKTHGTVL